MHSRLSNIVLAFAATLQVINAVNVCQSDPYKDLLFLSKYQIAEAYCSSYYPVAPVTTTVGAGKMKRNQATSTTLKTTTTTKSTSTTASSCTGACSTWTSCTKKGGAFVSTLCSCIEIPKTVTVSVTTTTAKPATTTTSKSATTTTSTTTSKPTTTTPTTITTTATTTTTSKPTTTTTSTTTTTTSKPTTTTTTTSKPTTTTTTTTTSTTTTTTTTTTTEAPIPTQCTDSRYIYGPSACACLYYVRCDTAATGTVKTVLSGLTIEDCVAAASQYPAAPGFTFDPVGSGVSVCTILSSVAGFVPATGQFAGTYLQGT